MEIKGERGQLERQENRERGKGGKRWRNREQRNEMEGGMLKETTAWI